MKYIALLILLSASCHSNPEQDKNTIANLSDTLSLLYKGKPAFVFGKSINALHTGISFYNDSGYSNKKNVYLTTDSNFSDELGSGWLAGNLAMETDDEKTIQKILAYWAITGSSTDSATKEAINIFRKKYFPNLPANFPKTKVFVAQRKGFYEEIKLFRSPDSGDVEHGFVPHWVISYEVRK
jgi:hypothetical protein